MELIFVENCKTGSSDTSSDTSSIYDIHFKAREVEKLIYQLDKTASLCKPDSFSFGNLPRKDQMTREMYSLLQEIRQNRFFMFHSYHFSIICENMDSDPSSNTSLYIRELCQMADYLKKAIRFYEWCGKED